MTSEVKCGLGGILEFSEHLWFASTLLNCDQSGARGFIGREKDLNPQLLQFNVLGAPKRRKHREQAKRRTFPSVVERQKRRSNTIKVKQAPASRHTRIAE